MVGMLYQFAAVLPFLNFVHHSFIELFVRNYYK